MGSDYQKSELEIQKNAEDLDTYIGELKSVITQYSRSLSPEKLGLHEDEEDHQKIEKARQVFVDENNKMLYSHNVIPLAVWYIKFCRVSKGEEYVNDLRKTCKFEI